MRTGERRLRLVGLLAWLTFCSCVAAIALYQAGEPGWAQLALLLGSGLAGGFVAALIE